MKRKAVSVLLCLAMLMSIFSVNVWAGEMPDEMSGEAIIGDPVTEENTDELAVPDDVNTMIDAQAEEDPSVQIEAPQEVLEDEQGSSEAVSAATPSICSSQEWEVLKSVNSVRVQAGLLPLTTFAAAQQVARLRSEEIITQVSHTRPDGSNFSSAYGPMSPTSLVGENLCAGAQSPSEAMKVWMNSEGHKKNILYSSYTHVGVGHTYNSKEKYINYWTQCFAGTCTANSISVQGSSKVFVVAKGTSLNDMGLVLQEQCVHGTSYCPLMESFCKGYDKNKKGVQTVTVSAFGKSTTFRVQVDNTGNNTGDNTLESASIQFTQASNNAIKAQANVNADANQTNLQYRWEYTGGNPHVGYSTGGWQLAQDWSSSPALNFCPSYTGDFVFVCKVRDTVSGRTIQTASSCHFAKQLKGTCQMPDPQGRGYLIGLESFQNPSNSYSYEMQIYDIVKGTWTYTTGKCKTNGNSMWTTWWPKQGCYWTFFQIYDAKGNVVDKQCYSFIAY